MLAAGCSSGGATAGPTASPTASSSPPSATPTGSPRPAPLPSYYRQRLAWRACGGGFECSTLRVPLDYHDPRSRLIGVAVIRLPATDRAHRIGSLLVNPGGPGGSGIGYARYARDIFPASVRARFDIVGFDPRGVGASDPVDCVTDAELDRMLALDPAPDTAAERQAMVDQSRAFAESCRRRDGALLSHVGSLDVARDMDVLRAAVGDRRLTFLGKSYGTFLGVKYAQLFPARVRALVLDGALDPAASAQDSNRVQALGFETDLRSYLHHCVSSGRCPLGATYDAALAELDRLMRAIDARPLPGGNGRTLGPGELFLGLAAGLYDPASGWPALDAAFRGAERGDGRVMLALSDVLSERGADGHYSNLIEANNAVNCIDRPSPRDVGSYDRQAAALATSAPHFGAAIVYSSMTCAFWPVPPVESAHPVAAPGAPPILVIGTTRDPATPYVWAVRLARQLRSGVLLSYDSDGHTAYRRGSACVDRVVDAYLLDLRVPADGTRCG